jgi:uncharacterized circularly permuted ATP-grasp superfamily protein
MGIQLVKGRDLFVDTNFVYMKTICGPKGWMYLPPGDDEFIDPLSSGLILCGSAGIMMCLREDTSAAGKCSGHRARADVQLAVQFLVP